jgi:DNA-binding MarR family transcriptional regulator
MTTPFEEIAGLDKLVHEPTRLAILTALQTCDTADFRYLLALTGLTKGNLSAHLWKLEEAGLVEIEKTFIDKVPNTKARLTEEGRRATDEYWKRLERLRDGASRWVPEDD